MSSGYPQLTSLPLCKECKPITFDDTTGTVVASHHDAASKKPSIPWERTDTLPSLTSFTSSAEAGCSFCKYLISVIRTQVPGPRAEALSRAKKQSVMRVTLDLDTLDHRSPLVELTSWGPANYENAQSRFFQLILLFANENWHTPWRHAAYVYAGSDQVAQHLGISLRLPAPHVFDPSSLAILDGWLDHCETNHARCKPAAMSSDSGELPTRLIDISGAPGQDPRLVDSASLERPVKYVALSYCWGPPSQEIPQLTTTNARLEAHKKAIPLTRMPSTFRDLIALASHFGLCYLWIDALCIVQDDYDDWEREAARMFLVYRNAFLTVAVGGSSCHSGFLKRSNFPPSATIPFRSRQRKDISGSYILASFPPTRTWEADGPFHLSNYSWAQRGWTFQEDIMSPRVLYFTDKTSFYRCQTHRCLEQDVFPHDNVRHWDELLYPAAVARSSKRVFSTWESLVITYSERKLTQPKDKFAALSGLAHMFAGALDDEYIAGLWRRQFHRGLLWYTLTNAQSPVVWRAPSWSWAAWDGLVFWLHRVGEPVVSQICLDEVHLDPVGQDRMGMLRGGWVVLTGRVQPVTARPTDREMDVDMRGYADVVNDRGEVIAQGSFDAVTISGLKIDGSYKPAPVEQVSSFKNLSALLIALTSQGRLDPDGDGTESWPEPSFPAGILITPVTQSMKGSIQLYRRVGVFYSDETSGSKMDVWDETPMSRVKLV